MNNINTEYVPSNKFINLKNDWNSFRFFSQKLNSSENEICYFDDLWLHLLPYDTSFIEKNILASLIFEEEIFHFKWSMSTSGCIQRIIEQGTREIARSLLWGSFSKNINIKIPITNDDNNELTALKEKLIIDDKIIKLMKFYDIFVQEIAGTLLTVLNFKNEFDLNEEQLLEKERFSLKKMSEILTLLSYELNIKFSAKEIEDYFYLFKEIVYKFDDKYEMRKLFIDSCILASEMIFLEIPSTDDLHNSKIFYQTLLDNDININSKYRFISCIESISKSEYRFLKNTSSTSPAYSTFLDFLGIDNKRTKDYFQYLTDLLKPALEADFFKDKTVNEKEKEDILLKESCSIIHIFRNCFDLLFGKSYMLNKKTYTKIFYPYNAEKATKLLWEHKYIFLKEEGKFNFYNYLYNYLTANKLKIPKNIHHLFEWQLLYIQFWWFKRQLLNPQFLDFDSKEGAQYSCAFENSNICDERGCQKCNFGFVKFLPNPEL